MQLNSYIVAGGLLLYIRSGSLFVHQIKDDFNRQVTKDSWVTMHALPCEVNGFVQIPYMRAVHMLHAHLPIAF